MPAVLAIDPGSRYVGVAVSNPEKTLAFPVTVLDATPKRALLAELGTIAHERTVDQLVVGRPVSFRGTPLR
ncbi:MAG: Holliday junction resolvase RuvX [Candidatus Andersenbacteria bacterium]